MVAKSKLSDIQFSEDTRLALLEQSIDHLNATLMSFETRFDQIDAKFNKMDGKFNQMDGKFNQMDVKFGQMDVKFGQMDAKFEKLDLISNELFLIGGKQITSPSNEDKTIETTDPKSDPGYKRINFEFYISDSKFKIDVDRIKKEVKRNLLNVKSENPDDEDLLQDLASIGMKEKTYSFSEIMDNLGDEKFMSGFCMVDDSDYFFQSEIEEGIRNPAEIWTKITSYGGEVKFDNLLFMDYVLDRIDTNSKK